MSDRKKYIEELRAGLEEVIKYDFVVLPPRSAAENLQYAADALEEARGYLDEVFLTTPQPNTGPVLPKEELSSPKQTEICCRENGRKQLQRLLHGKSRVHLPAAELEKYLQMRCMVPCVIVDQKALQTPLGRWFSGLGSEGFPLIIVT